MKQLPLVILTLLTLLCPNPQSARAQDATPAETKEQRDARMAWWRDARFGMFIHWGVYSVPAGIHNGTNVPDIGEWIMNRGKIPMAEYQEYAKQFNPVKFDADQWVGIAKNAGMKYMIITSKHHDGFAMFDSKTSDWNITKATPFHRDPLKELSIAAEKQGIKLGFYYSQAQDWNHPGGAANGGHWDPAQNGDMTEYIRNIAVPQVKELLGGNYGKVAVFWWDTPTGMTAERAAMLQPLLKLQPGIISNNRLANLAGYRGDTETPEQTIPATGYGDRDWETCMTMNDTWGFKTNDHNWKSVQTLLRNLIDIASKGGNYLLNVGPTSEGLIPQASVDRLSAIGTWMKANGDAIYGSTASPFKRLLFGRATQKPGKIYLEVFNWPGDGQLLVPIHNAITKAYLLGEPGKPLKVTPHPDTGGVLIDVPSAAPDPIASVVVMEFAGKADTFEVSPIRQARNGMLKLNAEDAKVGTTANRAYAKLEVAGGQSDIGYWERAADYVQWTIPAIKPGKYDVQVEFACAPDYAGHEYTVEVADQKLNAKTTATQSWTEYLTAKLGTLSFDKPDGAVLRVKPAGTDLMRGGLMNLRSVTLTPAH